MAATTSNGVDESQEPLDVGHLIVGLGPAGASLACFLASHGLKGLAISQSPSTAATPRAHITNPAAIECLRDIGLEDEVLRSGNGGQALMHTRWCYSMTGEEYARCYSWGHDPRRKGDYEHASPCRHIDVPQTQMEPILVKYATLNGFDVRFSTVLVKFAKESSGMILSELQDKVTGTTYRVRSKYLFGADGARSQIVKQIGLPLDAKPTNGLAINVVVHADLTSYMRNRKGNLHMIMQADRVHPQFGSLCMARMVKPWYEWMFILLPNAESFDVHPSNEEYVEHIKALIGDPSIKVDIISISRWIVNEVVASRYSDGNIFCLGDAVHRHPPMNGLGSNTCIQGEFFREAKSASDHKLIFQDSYNLAWKIAFVEKGFASPNLLDTYSTERQPVGLSVITQANKAFRHWGHTWEVLGLLSSDLNERKAALEELRQSTPEGVERRRLFDAAIKHFRHEFHGLGVEMGQRYQSSAIVAEPNVADSEQDEDPHGSSRVLNYRPSTIPGRRLPHVWLNRPNPTEPISTHDLAGKGAFCLFTGHGGELWKSAASRVKDKFGIPINAYTIGFRLDWEDPYLDWANIRGVEESGCVLVRPDRFVAWRFNEVIGDEAKCVEKLSNVMCSLLGLNS